MKTLNELLQYRNNKTNELETLKRNFERNESDLLGEIEKTERYIDGFKNKSPELARADQLVYFSNDRVDRTRAALATLKLFKKIIEDGELQELIDNGQNVSYWYNDGFRDGHARIIYNGYGENYATYWNGVHFTQEVREEKTQLTDEMILSLMAWVDSKIEEYSK